MEGRIYDIMCTDSLPLDLDGYTVTVITSTTPVRQSASNFRPDIHLNMVIPQLPHNQGKLLIIALSGLYMHHAETGIRQSQVV